jgi:hypothetical protein
MLPYENGAVGQSDCDNWSSCYLISYMKVNSLQLADPLYNEYSLFKILTAAAAHIAHYYQAHAERAQLGMLCNA